MKPNQRGDAAGRTQHRHDDAFRDAFGRAAVHMDRVKTAYRSVELLTQGRIGTIDEQTQAFLTEVRDLAQIAATLHQHATALTKWIEHRRTASAQTNRKPQKRRGPHRYIHPAAGQTRVPGSHRGSY